MELPFSDGKFVFSDGELNYKEVLDDFPNAKIIRIITYNISKNEKYDALLKSLKSSNADIQLITNIPSRMPQYYSSSAGQYMRKSAQKNIGIYVSKLNPEKFQEGFSPFFNVRNHAKLIGTENIVYIGSANYSNESADNIESGVLIRDKTFIQALYADFFEYVKNESLSYFDEDFMVFKLLVASLYAKFIQHHRKMLTDLYTDYERTQRTVAETIFMDANDLWNIRYDLEELDTVCGVADDTFDEENEEYNEALQEIKGLFSRLSIEWLKEMVSEGSSLYDLVTFDPESEVHSIIQKEFAFEAYDEYLDDYIERAMNDASEQYYTLQENFREEADSFIEEIESVIDVLGKTMQFVSEWQSQKLNPNIDNT